MPAFWVIAPDPIVTNALRSLRTRVVMNTGDIGDAMRAFFAGLPGDGPWSDPLPQGFPAPVLMLPDELRPDYFEWGGNRFVSERLRRTLMLPEEAASWVECNMIAAPISTLRYWMFHPRAVQEVVDLEHSIVRSTLHVSGRTGATIRRIDPIVALRFIGGIVPKSPVLVDTAIGDLRLLASEAVARLVVAAGCTGMLFLHPMWVIPGEIDGVVLGPTGPELRTYDEGLNRVVDKHAVEPAIADLGSQAV